MRCLLSIDTDLALVEVRDQHSIISELLQVKRLVLDFLCDSPPFLFSIMNTYVSTSLGLPKTLQLVSRKLVCIRRYILVIEI